MADKNNRPVTTEASPVRAPSPIPVPDSTKIWVEEAEPAPPAVTPMVSTSSTRCRLGMLPTSVTFPASRANPTEVPIASKNTDSRIAKTNRVAATVPIEENAPKENSPSKLRSGAVQPGIDGATRLQPSGLTLPASSTEGPMLNTASTMLAKMVDTTIPMRMAPGTLRTTRIAVNNSPTINTSTGQPDSSPPMPRPNGTVVPASSGTRRTNPEFTNPIRVINRPIPTTMPVLIESGTARNTAVRNPVSTNTTMTRPRPEEHTSELQ